MRTTAHKALQTSIAAPREDAFYHCSPYQGGMSPQSLERRINDVTFGGIPAISVDESSVGRGFYERDIDGQDKECLCMGRQRFYSRNYAAEHPCFEIRVMYGSAVEPTGFTRYFSFVVSRYDDYFADVSFSHSGDGSRESRYARRRKKRFTVPHALGEPAC
jgi:hypothetical protein